MSRACAAVFAAVVVAGAALIAAVPAGGAAPLPAGAVPAPTAQNPPVPSMAAAPPDDIMRGQDLFAVHCASCHGTAAEGTPDGIPLRGIGAATLQFVLTTGRMPLADPHQPMVRRASTWSRRDIDDITAFVTWLSPGGPSVPAVNPAAGDLARGRKLFAENCAACHGAAGQGAAVGEGADAPDLYEATPLEVAEAVRIGPDPMPRFSENVISDADLNSVVRYVLYLRAPGDRGGLALGHVGPVAEGFVAWIVGFGALAVIVRMIGTTR
jgi:ubiquinol-cytochrome c reductase cytochrome c subunit